MNENQPEKNQKPWKHLGKPWKPNKKFAKKTLFSNKDHCHCIAPKIWPSFQSNATNHRSYTIHHIHDSSKKVTTSQTNRRQIIIFNPLVKLLRNVRDCTSAQPWWKTETSGQLAGTKQPHGVTKLFDWWGNGVWLYLGWFAFRESKGCSVTSHAPQVGQYRTQLKIISVMFHFWQFI